MGQTNVHDRLGRIKNGGRVPLMPILPVLDSSLAARDEVKESEGRMVNTNEMVSDTNVDRGTAGARMS